MKQIKAPYVFDWEHGVALQAIQGNRASSFGVGEVSYIFSSCDWKPGYILELRRGWSFRTRVCSVTTRPLSSYGETSGSLKSLGRSLWMLSGVRQETEHPFLVATVILSFL